MGLAPNIVRRRENQFKSCEKCGQLQPISKYVKTKSVFYNGTVPICDDCLDRFLEENDYNWDAVDKICQYADLPFIPKEWTRIKEMNETQPFSVYAQVFTSSEYEGIGWADYYQVYKDLLINGELEGEIPLLDEQKKIKLIQRWGANYDDEALNYLEGLYNGLLTTQNVNGALQTDQAFKICKMSYEIDCRIREGADFDKLLNAYDKMVKAAEFTPKNVKNINDFDSVGELVRWLERKGWRNKFYDNVTRDVVDETIKNIQAFNQRLYVNETGIGEEITRRIEALKSAATLEKEEENYYGTSQEYDLDNFENDGYNQLFDGESDDFSAELSVDD